MEEAQESRCIPLGEYTPQQLVQLGVADQDFARQLTQLTEDRLKKVLGNVSEEARLPQEVIERLWHLISGTKEYAELIPPQVSVLMPSELFRRHPRDFWIPGSEKDIQRAIQGDWQQWIIFLHPAQREAVKRDMKGAIRIGGGAGTGKTVVAAHRTAWLAHLYPDARILLTTFVSVLADNLRQRVEQIIGPLQGTNIEVASLHSVADRLFRQQLRRTEEIADKDKNLINALLEQAIREANSPYDLQFVRPEWEMIIDPWRVRDLETYLNIERTGRKMPLQRGQREDLWRVLERMWRLLEERRLVTFSTVCHAVADYLEQHPEHRYRCVVVDEAQDFGPAELRLIRALAPKDEQENALFLCADMRQRIYRPATPWIRFGIDTRGRSYTLRVNYRTTRQIQDFAESVLPTAIEGAQEDEARILSERPIALMHGVVPEIRGYENIPAEMRGLKEWIYRCLNENIQPGEIAIFARSKNALEDVEKLLQEVLEERGIQARPLKRDSPPVPNAINYGTAHSAKGLEFRAVAVVCVTSGYFPNYAAIKDIADSAERKAKEDQERQLLYTARTRARERLYISWSSTTNRSTFLPSQGTSG